jgi:hypothetical protein
LPVGDVTIGPPGVGFPKIKVGKSSGLRTIRIVNPRKNRGPATISGIGLESQQDDEPTTGFTIQTAKSTCSVGDSIALGKECLIRVTFAPLRTGPVVDGLVVTGTFDNSGFRIGLAGTGK